VSACVAGRFILSVLGVLAIDDLSGVLGVGRLVAAELVGDNIMRLGLLVLERLLEFAIYVLLGRLDRRRYLGLARVRCNQRRGGYVHPRILRERRCRGGLRLAVGHRLVGLGDRLRCNLLGAEFDLSGALWLAAGPLAEAPHVARLREVQHRQNGEADDRREAGDSANV